MQKRLGALRVAEKRGLLYVKRRKESDGGFLSVTTKDHLFREGDATRKTTFHTSLILSALSIFRQTASYNPSDADHATQRVVRRIAIGGVRFLTAQKGPQWSFNYWVRNAPQHGRIPDDLDDTFMALQALHDWGPSAINGTALANIVKILIAAETKTGGPYNT